MSNVASRSTRSVKAVSTPSAVSTKRPKPRSSEKSLRKQILPALIFTVCVSQGGFIGAILHQQHQQMDEIRQTTAQSVSELVQSEMNHDVFTMQSTLDAIVRDASLMQAFQAKNRDAIFDRAKPLFDRLKADHQITHFYFHQVDRVNLLRIHKNMKGDLIDRQTLQQAQKTLQPASGLEQGPTGNPVLRVVYPWLNDIPQRKDGQYFSRSSNGDLIGYVELGVEFEDIASRVSKLLNVDVIIAMDKKFLDRDQWKERNEKLGRQSAWGDLPNSVIVDKTIQQVSQPLMSAIAQSQHRQNQPIDITQDGKILQVVFVPLNDIDGRPLGHVVALKDITAAVASANQSLAILLGMSVVIGVGLVGFFYLFLGRLEANLKERTQHLAEAKEKLQESNQALQTSVQTLQQAQYELVQREKMSNLGQLVSDIAQELDAPTSAIYNHLNAVNRYGSDLLELVTLYQRQMSDPPKIIREKLERLDFTFLAHQFPRILQSLQSDSHRISDVLQPLRNFSCLNDMEALVVDLHLEIDQTLALLKHRLQATSDRPTITVVKEYGVLPAVECYPQQVNQVVMNLLTNAIDALEERIHANEKGSMSSFSKPFIQIRTAVIDDQHITIRIADNGIGIADANKLRVFEPFFTTKQPGKGVGLGLSISRQIIVDRHGGTLACCPVPWQGSEFVIELPVQLPADLVVSDPLLMSMVA